MIDMSVSDELLFSSMGTSASKVTFPEASEQDGRDEGANGPDSEHSGTCEVRQWEGQGQIPQEPDRMGRGSCCWPRSLRSTNGRSAVQGSHACDAGKGQLEWSQRSRRISAFSRRLPSQGRGQLGQTPGDCESPRRDSEACRDYSRKKVQPRAKPKAKMPTQVVESESGSSTPRERQTRVPKKTHKRAKAA